MYDNEEFDINYNNFNEEKKLKEDENKQIIPNNYEKEIKKLNNESFEDSNSEKVDISFLEEISIDEDEDTFLSKKTKRLDVNELDKYLYSECEKNFHPKKKIKLIEIEEILENEKE